MREIEVRSGREGERAPAMPRVLQRGGRAHRRADEEHTPLVGLAVSVNKLRVVSKPLPAAAWVLQVEGV